MKRIIAILFSVVLIALSLCACGKDNPAPKGMILAKDTNYYTLYVPEKGWKPIETGSDQAFAQASAKTIIGGTGELSDVSVNAIYWLIDEKSVEGETAEEKDERLFNAYFNKYKAKLTGEFDQLGDGSDENKGGLFTEFALVGEPSSKTVGENSAREYIHTAKYGDFYYKYYMTVILTKNNYHVITFTFPQNVNVENGEFVKSTSVEDVTFNDSSYKEDMTKIVDNYIAKK